MRIQAGILKGRTLRFPGRKTVPPGARPTTGLVRKALFDLLAPRIIGSSFLDLCAGTGAVGLEAASRGAALVVLVEKDRRVLPCLEENLAMARSTLDGKADLLPRPPRLILVARGADSAVAELARAQETFDIVFADPPYNLPSRLLVQMCRSILAGGLLAADGVFILQHSRDLARDQAFTEFVLGPEAPFETRAYGTSRLAFFRPPRA